MKMDKFRDFWEYAGERAYKTFAQACLAAIGTGATGLIEVDWLTVLSVSGLATALSVLTSIMSYDPYSNWDEAEDFDVDAWLQDLNDKGDSK
jgi:hypothetical protein